MENQVTCSHTVIKNVLTERESSPTKLLPTPRMLGEYNFWVMEYAWQVSTIKKTSLYLQVKDIECWLVQKIYNVKKTKSSILIVALNLNIKIPKKNSNCYRLFCHICSKASASSTLVISSASWNLRKPSPPWPEYKTTITAFELTILWLSRSIHFVSEDNNFFIIQDQIETWKSHDMTETY